MQMESEICDLMDRKLISLYGLNKPNELSKAEVTGASELVKNNKFKKVTKDNIKV